MCNLTHIVVSVLKFQVKLDPPLHFILLYFPFFGLIRNISVLLWFVAPPDLVAFGVSGMGSEVVKKHQKAQHISDVSKGMSFIDIEELMFVNVYIRYISSHNAWRNRLYN